MIKYTDEQRKFFEDYAYGHHTKEIQEEFEKRFGIALRITQVKGCLRRWHLYTGFDGRFEKGREPHNAGTKLTGDRYKQSEPTMFKAGHKPYNTMPIGAEQRLNDGYIWVKIDNKPKVRKQVNWQQKHRFIWEQAYGPIPKNHLVIFLDGNVDNFELDNLACVSRAENAFLNNMHLRKNDKELTKSGLELARLQIKIKERMK